MSRIYQYGSGGQFIPSSSDQRYNEGEDEDEDEGQEELGEEENEGEEDEEVQEEAWADDDNEMHTSPPDEPIEGGDISYPGGPLHSHLLSGYKDHVARQIWEGQDERKMKVINHTEMLHIWDLKIDKTHPTFKRIVLNSGLNIISSCAHEHVEKTLICAFLERWHRETNSVHMPFGEMTMTLEDIRCLTGLNITGKPVLEISAYSTQKVEAKIHELLGIPKSSAKDGISKSGGGRISLEWLRTTFRKKVSDEKQAVFAARAYLLYVLGCTIFSDKSGNAVLATYLDLLRDVDSIGEYAWGAAALAFLYRQLGEASRYDCGQISGYITLFASWIYERFPLFSGELNPNFRSELPLSVRWAPKLGPLKFPELRMKRQQIDIMRDSEVIKFMYYVFQIFVLLIYFFKNITFMLFFFFMFECRLFGCHMKVGYENYTVIRESVYMLERYLPERSTNRIFRIGF